MLRPSVSMIVPFRGTAEELAQTVERLGALHRQDADELILVWNSADRVPGLPPMADWLQICVAAVQASSYYARNVGVRSSRNDWLLFVDADCSPSPALLDLYFAGGEYPADVGVIAGGIVGTPGDTLVERYANARDHIGQRHTLGAKPLGYGQTANLLVRKKVWSELGGFAEGIISGGDADFCWRAQLSGVTLSYAEAAVVHHHHRQSIADLWRQYRKYGRGQRWLDARFRGAWPESLESRPSPYTVRDLLGIAISRSRESVLFVLLDSLTWVAFRDGWIRSNAAPLLSPGESRVESS